MIDDPDDTEDDAALARVRGAIERARRGDTRVAPAIDPGSMQARWPAELGEAPAETLSELIERVLDGSTFQHHPGYVGYQLCAPLPRAALLEHVAALLNNGMASYDSGPANTASERAVVRWLADRLGWAAGDGVLTSGGSLGNLTALLAARQSRAGFDAWHDGAHAGPPLAILTSEHAHYSIARAAAIAGLGAAAVITVEADSNHRMRADDLALAARRAEAVGRKPFCVVANAGSTGTGAIDPLAAIADECERLGLWLHVDGAHGASMWLSERLRPRLSGLERADSVVWDAHKMLQMPALNTAVLFRRAEDGWLAFHQKAPYLYGQDAEREYDLGQRTLECTKRGMGLALYGALRTLGVRPLIDVIEALVERAAAFADRIEAAADFELLARPSCNILCFRLRPPAFDGDLELLQVEARARVNAEGAFFLARTEFRGQSWLRTTISNPLTTDAHLDALLDALRASVNGASPRERA